MKQESDIDAVNEQRKEAAAERRVRRAADFSREAVLIVCLVLLVVLFAITAVVSRLYHKKVHQLGDQWFAHGETSFRSGEIPAALIDYRNALVYSPNNEVFQLHLAQALAEGGREDEARSYLINLLAESPGSGEINLELARIAARQGLSQEAIRYYHSAIYGVWENDPLMMRWRVRNELVQYLLDRGDLNDAQPEAIALAQEVPAGDVSREREAGQYLLRLGMWARALNEFELVLKSNRRDADALAAAGTAAFRQGEYGQALTYFERLPREKSTERDIADMFETSRQIQSASPFLPRLSNDEKAQRITKALAQAASRATACIQQRGESVSATPPVDDLQKLLAASQAMSKDWSELNLKRHPDRLDAAMSQVFDIENVAAQECGEPTNVADRALLLLGRSQGDIGQ
jgi:tetratricopeptide (TPR) repeat protein